MNGHGKNMDPVDKGLAEAFGDATAQPPQSVLRALESRTGSKLGVHLESEGLEDAPVKVTEETRQLRDPSGRYQVVGEIGRGAVGVVYKGRDVDLGRDVAMKILKDEYAERPDILARFVEEAQIGGQLQHPGIVPVYELGLQHGERPYFAMKLVKGETLAAQLVRRTSPAEDRRRLLGIFEQVCQTIAYAHARRVVHRDLKPANVMIGAFGEVQVVDWGFAKVLPKGGIADEKESVARASQRSIIETVRSAGGSGSQSVVGSLFGTPAYMPPEQALGDIDRLDQRSDVFGLGAILCEILTGVPPYLAEDGDLVRQAAAGALEGAYERLRKCGADDALVELCTECLSRARRARPGSAAELAERIGEYLTSVEERARQSEVRAARAHYRQRTTLVSAAAGLLVLALGAGTWVWMESEARSRRDAATQRVSTAMSTTSGALGQAQAASLDLTLWSTAVASAEQLASLASSEDVDADTRHEAGKLVAQVRKESEKAHVEAQRRARDAAMLERLQNLRIPRDHDVRADSWAGRENRRLDRAYGQAFAEYLGKPLFEHPQEQALALLRGGIETELATSLDHWGMVRDGLSEVAQPPDSSGTAQIRELARLLDGNDHWRSQLRALLPNAADEKDRLQALADRADFESLTAAGCRVLGDALRRAGAMGAALRVLTRAQEVHPQDFDLCFRLALYFELLEEPQWQQAVRTYRIANALKPDHNEVLHRQGIALQQLGRHGAAERAFRELSRRQPQNDHWLFHLGLSNQYQRKPQRAIQLYERTIEANPKNVTAYVELGYLLLRHGRPTEALERLQHAVRIAPGNAQAHTGLARVLRSQGRPAEAIQSYQRALKVNPRHGPAHINLGNLLHQRGDLRGALACFRAAADIFGGKAEPGVNRQPSAFRRRWRNFARRQIKAIEPRLALLTQVITGARLARSSKEWSAAIQMEYYSKHYPTIVEVTETTLRSAPELIDGPWGLYNSACAAVLGAADEEAGTSSAERARLRGLAHDWLAREIERWRDVGARRRLEHPLQDEDFASVRGDALAALPEDERREWQELWIRIERAAKEKEK